MDNIQEIVNNITILISVIVISNLNQGIKDFFTNGMFMFIIFTLYNYYRNRDILLSLATAFVMVMLIIVVTVEDPGDYLREGFDLLYPGPNSKVGCEKIVVKDLLDKFGNLDNLKRVMVESGVPYNLNINDTNAPEIATYIINKANSKISESCRLPN